MLIKYKWTAFIYFKFRNQVSWKYRVKPELNNFRLIFFYNNVTHLVKNYIRINIYHKVISRWSFLSRNQRPELLNIQAQCGSCQFTRIKMHKGEKIIAS